MAEAAFDDLPRFSTQAAFLEWEARQPLKYEWMGGRPVAMVGGTRAHSLIITNLAAALRQRLRGSGCRPMVDTPRLAAPDGFVYHPDVLVTCGEGDPRATTLADPVLIVEVLSAETSGLDHAQKWLSYQQIAALRHYVMVWQGQARVEAYDRTGDGWHYRLLGGMEAALPLGGVGLELPLAEVYEDVAFPPPEVEPPSGD